MKWFHKFFNPHCEHCMELERERRVCLSCETLRTQLAESNYGKKQLLQRVLQPSGPVSNVVIEPVESDLRPVQLANRHLPWASQRARLEEASRLKKLELDKEESIRKDLEKKNKELEKEVLGAENHA